MVITLAITVGNSVKSLIVSEKALMIACSAGGRVSAGMIRILRESVKARRRVISVAKRVQRLLFLGKGISVKASKTELFSVD